MADDPQFLNPLVDIRRHGTSLPHWQQDGATYFVTFSLADALPQAKLAPWRDARDAWMRRNPRPWTGEQDREYHQLFHQQMEDWLDAGSGACVLRDVRAAGIVGAALSHFEGRRCRQHAWVVMPNHVHTLFSLCPGHRLEDLLRSWKSYSAKGINNLHGRNGALWQANYHDRLIRSSEHFSHVRDYIRRNPERAGLSAGTYLLFIASGQDAPTP